MEQENGMGLGELLHRAYIAVKRRIVLVFAVILIITGGGAVIANIRKPMYTASERASYKAGMESTTSSYFRTVVDFCNSGCVIDRANFYYDYYSKNEYNKVSDFIEDVKTAVSDENNPLYYDTDKIVKEKYISEDRVGISASAANATSVSYIITVRYTDANYSAAQDKVKILLQAIGDEANLQNDTGKKYFGTEITITDLELYGYSSDWSKTKIVSIAFVISVIVALLSVYVINLTDRTVKEKNEIERITGTDLLAFIEDQEA